jgi:cell division septal protein FtsQ
MLFIGNNLKIKRANFGKNKFIYSKKIYSNPLFQHRHKRARIIKSGSFASIKVKLVIFALIIFTLLIIWLLFFSTLFKITKIEVGGVGENAVKEIEALARGVAKDKLLGKNNLLLYNKSELSQLLNDKYYLQSLDIKRKLPHTLKIALQEQQRAAVWHEDDGYFYLDSEGGIINQVDPLNVNRSEYPVIENLTSIKIEERKANIEQPMVNYILNLFDEFKNKKHGFEVENFILDKDANTVKMAVLAGPRIYFDIKETVAKQASRLDLIIKGKLRDEFKNKEYIDLRYGNNIYIK